MKYREHAFSFDCAGDPLVGIVAAPDVFHSGTGILVIVGGPQYRVGSHRQFVLLSRELAENGVPCMRFDYRGMGDSPGAARTFEAVDTDIRAAIDAYFRAVPRLERVVLWGLCDAASAAAFYAPSDSRVEALVLLNPWVRTQAGVAKTYLKHYYLRRIFDPKFWRKLLEGTVEIGRGTREALAAVQQATARRGQDPTIDLPSRMAARLKSARLPTLFVLSGRDYVANEFEQVCAANQEWARLLADASVERLADADHTFASADWRASVAQTTLRWVEALRAKRSDMGS